MIGLTLILLLGVSNSLALQVATPVPTNNPNVYIYDFYLTWAMSMTYTDQAGLIYDVALDQGELFYTPSLTRVPVDIENVTTLGGAKVRHIAINGHYPGPTIEVPLGALVYVRVHNGLMFDAATIHWHGLNMKGSNATGGVATPWADGVAYVTQCPISPGAVFTYKFVANEAGTFWYHSHQGMQKMDGLFGAVIVYDPVKPSYPSFTLVFNDLLHAGAAVFAVSYIGPDNLAGSYLPIDERYDDVTVDEGVFNFPAESNLINGRGRIGNNTAPLEIHRVSKGEEYLFRIVNAGFDDEFEFSIDGHKLTLVGVDSCEVEPVVVDSVFLAIGERVNVLVKADQPIGNYWVRYRAPDKIQTSRGYSILSYTNSSADPITSSKVCDENDECVAVNCPFHAVAGWICIPMHELNSTSYHEAEIDQLRGDNITERFYAYTSLIGHTINGRSLVLPESNFFQDPYNETGVTCIPEICNHQHCQCTHVDKLPVNSIIQMVITHTVLMKYLHTWHMHGYRFAVLKVAYPIKDNVTGLSRSRFKVDINCSNDLCYDAHWMREELRNITVDKPPLKDNLLIPVGGYAVIRIYTDNPGYWMAHCHQAAHLHLGMAMVFDVDGESVKDTIPPNFPACGDFLLDEINL